MHETVLVLVLPETASGKRKPEEQVRDEAERLMDPFVYSEEYLYLAALDLLTPEMRAERPEARYDACGLDPAFAMQVEETDPTVTPRLMLFGPHGIATYRVWDLPDGPPFSSIVTPDGEHLCPLRNGPRTLEEALERHGDCLAVVFTTHF